MYSNTDIFVLPGPFSALGYLYSSVSLSLIHSENARAVLAAGCLLGGMDDLCSYSYDACRQSITVDTITGWLDFADAIPSPSDGTSTPRLSPTSLFGQYAQRLKDDVFRFLVVTLPGILEVSSPPPASSELSASPVRGSGRDTLLQIFSRVPFDMFKAAVESAAFHIGTFLDSIVCQFGLTLPASVRLRSDEVQVRQRSDRNAKAGHCTRNGCRRDGGPCLWRIELWGKCGACDA